MADKHGVCGAELRDFMQAGADEVAGGVGVAFGWEVGGVAVDDGLVVSERLVPRPTKEKKSG